MKVQCEEPFDVSGTGRTKEEAKQEAYQNARNFCETTHAQDCPAAKEVGPGEYKDDGQGNITYITRYKCTVEP